MKKDGFFVEIIFEKKSGSFVIYITQKSSWYGTFEQS